MSLPRAATSAAVGPRGPTASSIRLRTSASRSITKPAGLGHCGAARGALARPRFRQRLSQRHLRPAQVSPGVAIRPADLARRPEQRAVLDDAEQQPQPAVADDEVAVPIEPHLRLDSRSPEGRRSLGRRYSQGQGGHDQSVSRGSIIAQGGRHFHGVPPARRATAAHLHSVRARQRRADARRHQGTSAAKGIRAGSVWVNCYQAMDPAMPFGVGTR